MREDSEEPGTAVARPRLGGSRWSALRWVALFWAGYLVIILLAGWLKWMAPSDWREIVWGLGSVIALLVLTGWTLGRVGLRARDVGLRLVSSSWARFVGGLVIGGGVYGVTLLAIHVATGPLQATRLETPSFRIVALTLMTFAALGSMEELGFRGFALRTLVPAVGHWPAQAWVALAFSATHILFGWSWEAILFGVLPSAVLFGVAATVSGGLAIPLGIHVGLNVAIWACGEGKTPGIWALAFEQPIQGQEARWATVIGIAVTLGTAALFWAWHRHYGIRETEPPVSALGRDMP